MKLSLLASAALSFCSATALAQEAAPAVGAAPAAAPARKLKDVSLTVSPLHLVSPVVELMGEYRVNDKFGVAVIGGVGAVKAQTPCINVQASSSTCETDFLVVEAGAQGAYYLLGDFNHGLQLGAEALYVHVASNGGVGGDAKISGNAAGLAVSPFVGYKYVAPVGLTLLAQVGPTWITARAEATDGTNSGRASDRGVGLMLNLNAGWSF